MHWLLIISIFGETPAIIAAYEQEGDCQEIAYMLDSAMPMGVAFCETSN